ncbi:hypothetical protein TC41_0722 [Alicyclobacillus acidocaldarius subsp. acidocaldarius Tc-4-1]|uniref:Uncharacterized protein n=1 Tax=Alicyclobacillus acidocaldarius (strain Tc-4-1) TaxID=1048834 RepID=F8IEG6_ALIAT|nr:hypothetical protein TC41_0722 [Alicyclobacillus acidocaldarius subsp. acidocaldarius Tc-4-1]
MRKRFAGSVRRRTGPANLVLGVSIKGILRTLVFRMAGKGSCLMMKALLR